MPDNLDNPEAKVVVASAAGLDDGGRFKSEEEFLAHKEATANQKGWVPWSVTSFAALDESREARAVGKEVSSLTADYSQIIDNILWAGAIETKDKITEISRVTAEFDQRLNRVNIENLPGLRKEAPTGIAGVVEKVKELIKGGTPEDDTDNNSGGGMLVWKDADDGQWRWLASYSNNFRDADFPPEIISADSHRGFVKAVDAGETPHPELWLWHEKSWKVGQADFVTIDEKEGGTVFAVAGGYFDEGTEEIAEALSKMGAFGVSHGMPLHSLQRNEGDQSVIEKHSTVEISPLPLYRAANKLAAFHTLLKETDMSIPTQKREELATALKIDKTVLDALEESNTAAAAVGKDAGLEQKEASAEDASTDLEADSAKATDETADDITDGAASKAADGDDEVRPITMADIPEFTKALKEGMADPILAQLKELSDRVEAIEASDDDKVKAAIAETPAAAFNRVVKSVIGDSSTKVDGRLALAKDAPAEAEHEKSGSQLPKHLRNLWD